jgi:hypothetical protein
MLAAAAPGAAMLAITPRKKPARPKETIEGEEDTELISQLDCAALAFINNNDQEGRRILDKMIRCGYTESESKDTKLQMEVKNRAKYLQAVRDLQDTPSASHLATASKEMARGWAGQKYGENQTKIVLNAIREVVEQKSGFILGPRTIRAANKKRKIAINNSVAENPLKRARRTRTPQTLSTVFVSDAGSLTLSKTPTTRRTKRMKDSTPRTLATPSTSKSSMATPSSDDDTLPQLTVTLPSSSDEDPSPGSAVTFVGSLSCSEISPAQFDDTLLKPRLLESQFAHDLSPRTRTASLAEGSDESSRTSKGAVCQGCVAENSPRMGIFVKRIARSNVEGFEDPDTSEAYMQKLFAIKDESCTLGSVALFEDRRFKVSAKWAPTGCAWVIRTADCTMKARPPGTGRGQNQRTIRCKACHERQNTLKKELREIENKIDENAVHPNTNDRYVAGSPNKAASVIERLRGCLLKSRRENLRLKMKLRLKNEGTGYSDKKAAKLVHKAMEEADKHVNSQFPSNDDEPLRTILASTGKD